MTPPPKPCAVPLPLPGPDCARVMERPQELKQQHQQQQHQLQLQPVSVCSSSLSSSVTAAMQPLALGQLPQLRHSTPQQPLLQALLVSQAQLQSSGSGRAPSSPGRCQTPPARAQSPDPPLSPLISPLGSWGWSDCQQASSPRFGSKCGSPRFGSIPLDERRAQMTRVSATIDELLSALVGEMTD